jgi:hypothetical protein
LIEFAGLIDCDAGWPWGSAGPDDAQWRAVPVAEVVDRRADLHPGQREPGAQADDAARSRAG